MALLHILRVPRFVVLLFPLAFCATLQMRFFLDPLLGFAGVLQVVAALTLGSAILFVSNLRNPRPAAFVTSLVLLAVACAEYEAALAFGIIYPALALAERRGWRGVLRASRAPIAVTFVFIGIAIALRLRLGSEAPYRADLSPQPALWAFVHQFSGAIPLSYFAVSGSLFGSRGAFVEHRFTITGNVAFLVSAGIASVRIVWEVQRDLGEAVTARLVTTAGVVGLSLAVAPELLLSISPRWQPDIRFGVAYLPVEIQSIGVAVLLVVGVWLVVTRMPGRFWANTAATVACIAVATVASVTFLANDLVVDVFAPGKAARAFEEHSLRVGLLDQFPHATAIVPDPMYPWASQAGFFYANAHRRLTVASLPSLTSTLAGCKWSFASVCAPFARSLLYRIGTLPSGRGFALVCPIRILSTRDQHALTCRGPATVVLDRLDGVATLCSGAQIAGGSAPPSRLVAIRRRETHYRGTAVCRGVIRAPATVRDVGVVQG
jgi:hypothetical protein